MQLRLRPLVTLLALVSLLNQSVVVESAVVDGEDDTPTQIESPPEDSLGGSSEDLDGDEEGDEGEEGLQLEFDLDAENNGTQNETDSELDQFDLDYNVKRPANIPEEVKICGEEDDDEDNNDEAGDDDAEEDCVPKQADLKPYERYKGYDSWERRPLFVIIIGGLRWDYLTKSTWNMTEKVDGEMVAFNWMKKHGATLSQVTPVFPPYDLPTWTSLATGLYPQTTGVTGDYMFDLKTKKLFNREESLDGWWMKGEPIWSIAAKNNRKVSVLNWHDCTLPGFQIENQVDCKPFNTKSGMPTKQKLNSLFSQAFAKIHSSDYDLSIVYTDAVKKAALRYGPNSKEVMDTLADLDDVLQGRLSDIKNKKERANLKLNILLLSDYGLNTREGTVKLVLDDYIDFHHVQYIIQRGGSTVLVPYALKAGGIMDGVATYPGVGNMVGVDAFVRDVDLQVPPLEYPVLPPELKYSGYTWTQDILLLAKPGFEIEIGDLNSSKVLPPWDGEEELGVSGYRPSPHAPHIVPGRAKHKSPELRAREKVELDLHLRFAAMMKTIGFAWGPDFKPGYVSEPLELVDIYQVLAFLLQVDPNHHEGNWDRVKGMLMLSAGEHCVPTLLSTIIAVALTHIF